MKWIYPVKIVYCVLILINYLAFVVPQGLNNYKSHDTDRYSYKNHPAVRRAKYLYGDVTPENRLPKQHKNNDNIVSSANNDEIFKGYNRNELQNYLRPQTSSKRTGKQISQADRENAKFLGVNNQEHDEDASERGLGHLKLKRLRRLLRQRCSPFGRDAYGVEQGDNSLGDKNGRFLFDLNVYNIHAAPPVSHANNGYGCGNLLGGGGGFLGGGGLLSDPLPPAYPVSPLNNFLGLFAPGILQNSLAVTARPPPAYQQNPIDPVQVDPDADNDYNYAPQRPNHLVNNQLQSDPNVDPGYAPPQYQSQFRPQLPPQRPNRLVNNQLQSDPNVDPGYAPPQYQSQFRPQLPPQRPNQVYFDSTGPV